MKILKLLLIIYCLGFMASCKSDGGDDDTMVEMSDLTGIYWYNNRWLGDKYSYDKEDLLQVLKFEKNGTLAVMDYGGRKESVVGNWSNNKNEIVLTYKNGTTELWDVMHSGSDYIKAVVNGGERTYKLKPENLEELTADAFLVNEIGVGNKYATTIGVDVRGNNNIREGALILSADPEEVIALENKKNFWCEKNREEATFAGTERDVRFYFRIGGSYHLKLSDRIYADNLEQRTADQFDLSAVNPSGVSTLNVSWNPFNNTAVYYRVEIFNKDMDLVNPVFISRIQSPETSLLKINATTAGEVNRMGEIKAGETYTVRLSSILFEPGIDVINNEYATVNIQAITYITKKILWE